MKTRRKTCNFKIGDVGIGSDYPITIQTMLNIKTSDERKCISESNKMYELGCDFVRVAVPLLSDVEHFANIQKKVPHPLIADVHYSYKIAFDVIKAGAKKIRINPGNMTDYSNIKQLSKMLLDYDTAVRIGVNCGSIHPDYQKLPIVDALVNSAVDCAKVFESYGVKKIVLGIKSSDALETIEANRKLASLCNYPLHIGVTEAGTLRNGLIKSSYAIGTLLSDGIGDTIRVSLTEDLEHEIYAGKQILKMLHLDDDRVDVVSCPTCSRTEIDVKALANKVEELLSGTRKNLRISVLGCPLNGIGEAKNSDYGIAGGKEKSVILINGKQHSIVDNKDLLEKFLEIVSGEIK